MNNSKYDPINMHHLSTSNSFIIGTGLKKCKPPNLSWRFVAEAISLTGRADVLVLNITCLEENDGHSKAIHPAFYAILLIFIQ